MDIKSKSSKKFSYLIAIILVLLSVASYIAMYPVFEKRADNYYTDVLHSEQFLYEIYQSNTVLYKDMVEKVQGKTVRYQDLYLKLSESTVEDESELDYADVNSEAWKIEAGNRMDELLEAWNVHMLSGLAREMDYCMIDHETGQVITNTGTDIKNLGTEKAGEELDALYKYYIRMSYDKLGNLENVSVKSNKSDQLLKKVQSIMRSYWLQNNFWAGIDTYYTTYADGSFYYFDEEGVPKKGQTSIQNTPKDTTFIFALTQEQQAQLLSYLRNSNFIEDYWWAEEAAYQRAGTSNFLLGILIFLTVMALLLTRCRKYCLHLLDGVKFHLEISLIALYILLLIGMESLVGLVNYTNRGYFDQSYLKYLTWLPEGLYPLLTVGINVVVLLMFFGAWYYFVTSLGEITTLGIRKFIAQRSLLLKLWKSCSGFCKNRVTRFKDEILHVDLGEKTTATIGKLVIINFLILSAACVMWVFGWGALIIYSVILYFCLKKYVQKIQEQYQKLFEATSAIAEGNLHTEFKEDWGIFESYKEELNKIQSGFSKAVDEEVKSQKMKTELISNVSHDLKTPLTAITTYIELLKDENITLDQRKEYLEVLEKKSSRLKFLIEDLFEVSKANSGNVPLTLVDVDICNLMRQVYLEYEDRVAEADLTFRFQVPDEKVVLLLDSQKTFRIFENLYTNILKYAMPHTRVYVTAVQSDDGVTIELKNTSASELNILPEDLTERFVRGDRSRNTEGSGLGLTIAKSFTELQGGKLKLDIDGDLFKVTLFWPKASIVG